MSINMKCIGPENVVSQQHNNKKEVLHMSISMNQFFTNLKFGVEIECIGPVTREETVYLFQQNNIPVKTTTGYSHQDSSTQWKVTIDSSILPIGSINNPMEIVSPILIGHQGLEQLKMVLTLLNQNHFETNESCSIHVHIDAATLSTMQSWKNLIGSYARFQTTINTFLAPDRHRNNFARRTTITALGILNRSTDILSYSDNTIDRYRAVNVRAFLSHGTVEFRQHEHSLDYTEIENWILFVAALTYDASTRKTPFKLPDTELTTKPDDFMNLFDRLCNLGLPKEVRKHFASKRNKLKKASSQQQQQQQQQQPNGPTINLGGADLQIS